jgi:Asp-tRNA(Asn)/Glu-tRNA(Gln) amidotransferase A subunit family amidase
MDYDTTPVRAPRTAGTALKILARVVENGAGGAILSGTLLAGAGIPAMRKALADEPPWPLGTPRIVSEPAPPGGPPVDLGPLHALAQASASTARDHGRATAAELHAAYSEGRTDPEAVARSVLEACAASNRTDPPLRAIIAQDADDVLRQARESAARWRAGAPLGPLDGIPVAVKDELDQVPYPTTVGTSFLNDPAHRDATAVARLRAAGAILIGKANMQEIGMDVTGVNPHHGTARNPHDPLRATGGSSSGPAAAVASGLCPIAIGADGGGSIRIPSSFCGVVGLKPTFGRVSEHGAAPLCWSLAHVGPIGLTVHDVALAYATIAGPDVLDPNTMPQPRPTLAGLYDGNLAGLRIGVFRPWFQHADPDVVARCDQALDVLTAAGASIVDVVIPELSLLRAVHIVTIVSEMVAAQDRYYCKHRTHYGAGTRLNIALGRMLRSTDYIHAQRIRTRLCGHFDRVLHEVDVIATPTSARTSFVIPLDSLGTGESNVEQTTSIMRYAQAANLAGLPAITVPAGIDHDGMPVGFQLMGRHWDEALLLRMARVVQDAMPLPAPGTRYSILPRD